ncbi:hypothetical protein KVR01_011839 [Diaporthe batatas]|uniref:uncharacterized protein n=1 Tax=Diaporthe batatas TaxID=748121 RepID=UPI001D044400|nr:uncharacterized protein KVR01_011839 [Diaporthe batatas]KAG8158078.1 hypothetical protein KVR01_011839 [Diaporthe batatas]
MDSDAPEKTIRLTRSEITDTSSPSIPTSDEFGHLPDQEADILRQQVSSIGQRVGVTTLFRYASSFDIVLLSLSAISSILGGAALPLMTLLFGNFQGTIQGYFLGRASYQEYIQEMTSIAMYFVYLAIGEFALVYIGTTGFIYSGERISNQIREHYLESCLRQNIAYFDTKMSSGEITTSITTDINQIKAGISEKLGITLAAVATFISAFAIGFAAYWKLTLVVCSSVFVLLAIMGIASSFITTNAIQLFLTSSSAGSLAGEILGSVRTAVAFGNEERLATQYDGYLKEAEKYGFKVKAITGVMVAGMMLVLYLNYALSFWAGSIFLINGQTSLSKILTVMMAIMMGAFDIGHVAAHVQAITMALGSAKKIFDTIDRVAPPSLDPTANTGEKIDQIQGAIRFESIKHIYPSRPDVVVLNDFTLDIPVGKMTAIVGASGSGKSTLVGLLARFYIPVRGRIYLDGRDTSTLSLPWLRENIGLVGQNPTLFNETIYNNILYGLSTSALPSESAERQQELVINAAKTANAHNFISELPRGYHTVVGERGFLLSGGQKQRICIARAIILDSKILVLDEATSALDSESEKAVQIGLNQASAGRTVIVVAHRLSTIQDADQIVVLSQGCIVEQGVHEELLSKRGAYFKLFNTQRIAAALSSAEVNQSDGKGARPLHDSSTASTGAGEKDIVEKMSKTHTGRDEKSRRDSPEPGNETKYGLWTSIKFIASLNKQEQMLMLLGLFFAAICGAGNPVQAVFFAKEITVLSQPLTSESSGEIKTRSDFWSLMYLVLAIVQFIAFTIQGLVFARCSERLIQRVRDMTFRHILRQDIAFFDNTNVGTLTSLLSTETANVAGLSGATLGTLLTVSTTLIGAAALGLALQWNLSLVIASTIPVLLACGYLRFHMLARFSKHSQTSFSESAALASETITALPTIAALVREDEALNEYRRMIRVQQARSLVSTLQSSALYAASQSAFFLVFALGFWYGGTLLARHEIDQFQFFACFSAIVFGAQSAGTFFSYAREMGNAHSSTSRLKSLFDRRPTIDTWSHSGEAIDSSSCAGTIEFRDVKFRYPERLDQPVLRGLNLKISAGQYIGLVGASGSGKSTIIAMLERFYDPDAGTILLDGRDIRTLNLNQYRSIISLVSQEPVLYQGTIKDNILLGMPNSDEINTETIEKACVEASIHNFIVSLPDGLDTNVGNSGVLLSGGQKQRIALARALIRKPRLLLLDEATSSLDSESESVVQDALDRAARGGRTTIAVAHRLSTVRNADTIYVLDNGGIAEMGTHDELMRMEGRYAQMIRHQSTDTSL